MDTRSSKRRARTSSTRSPRSALAAPWALAAALAGGPLAGCVAPGPPAGAPATGPADAAGTASVDRDVASRAPSPELRALTDELVGTFARVGSLAPDRVEAFVPARGDPVFARALEASLRAAGYRLAERAFPDALRVDHAIVPVARGRRYTLGMGGVQVRRDYRGPARSPVPAGPLYVHGVDASSLRPEADAPDERAGSAGDGRDGLVARALGSLDAPVAEAVPVSRIANPPDLTDPLFGWRTVAERTFVLADEPVRLDGADRAVLGAAIARFRPDTDAFSIVGCALAPTPAGAPGTRSARARVERVERTLLEAGVPPERVVDEGCWAGEAGRRLPEGAVVLTLRRRDGTPES